MSAVLMYIPKNVMKEYLMNFRYDSINDRDNDARLLIIVGVLVLGTLTLVLLKHHFRSTYSNS